MVVFRPCVWNLLVQLLFLFHMEYLVVGKIYLRDNVRRTWDKSKAFCESKHMRLVSVPGYDDYIRLVNFIKHTTDDTCTTHVWLGLRLPDESNIEADYRWMDGTKLTWTHWDATSDVEPNKMDTSKCVVVRAKDRFTYDSKPCDYTYCTICQRRDVAVFERMDGIMPTAAPLVISLTSTPTSATVECSRVCASDYNCQVFVVEQGTCYTNNMTEINYLQCTDPTCAAYRRKI